MISSFKIIRNLFKSLPIRYIIILTSCTGSSSDSLNSVEIDLNQDKIALTPVWDSYTLPDLDSSFYMQKEGFYDGFMLILGEDYPSAFSNHVTTESETMYQWCYYPKGRTTDIEIQFMPINAFMKTRIDGFLLESNNDRISAVLYEDDSTYLYEFYDTHDPDERKFYNFLLERNGYYIISGPNVRYDINSHAALLNSLTIAESFRIERKPNDHSLDDFEIHDLHAKEWEDGMTF
jgi:hypothetical protein